jgi:F-type H+-transporting ATPase subunit delta
MIVGSLARRYARALFQIGLAEGSQDGMLRELEDLTRACELSQELRQALHDPVSPLEQRRRTLEVVGARLGVGPMVRNLALLLLDRHRFQIIPDVTREFRTMVDEHAGRVRARIVSASPLSPELEARLRSVLEQRMHRQVVIEKHVDPSLIGGLSAEVGGVLYDGSLKCQMENLKKRMTPA